MTTDQLRYFLAVKKYLNYSEAAETLNISQSSLSRQIQTLEEDVGALLFSRTTRRIVLTSAGEEFARYAEQMLELYQKLCAQMKVHSSARKNKLILSSVPVMSIYGLPLMIAAFNEQNPDIAIDIIEDDTLYVLREIREHRSDLAFSDTSKLSGNEYLTFPLVDDEMVLIVPKNHRFGDKNRINLSETSEESFLFLGAETMAYKSCMEECIKAGFEPKVLNSPNTSMQIETIIDFVSRGRAVSLINGKAAEYYWKPDIRIIRLEQKIRNQLGFVVRNDTISPACMKLIDFGLNYYRAMQNQTGPN